MDESRGREWRRRWDPPLSSTTPSTTTINQLQPYPAETVSHQQQQHSQLYQQQNYPVATAHQHQLQQNHPVATAYHQQKQHFNPNQHQQNYPAATASHQQQQQQQQQQHYPAYHQQQQYSNQHQQNYPAAASSSHQDQQQHEHTSQQFYKEEYDQDDDDHSDDYDQDQDDDGGNGDDYDDDDFDDDEEDYNTYGESTEVQEPQTTTNNNNNRNPPVIIRCILIKIGDYKLGLLKKKNKQKKGKKKGQKKKPGQIKVTINGSGGSGFIHVQTNTPDFFDIVHKKVGKCCDFRIPLSSVESFKLYNEHEPKFMGNLTSGFIQVSAEEGDRIRQMFNLTNEHFDPNCNDDVIERKYIKFSTKNQQMKVKRVAKISQIFGHHRMEMIGRESAKFYLNGLKENTYVKRGKKRFENLKNELSFTCSSIHFGKYSYQGDNTVFLSDTSNSVSISMKHSSGQKMALVRIPNRKKIIYNLAQYTEQNGENKLMIYTNVREKKFANTFGQAIGVNLISDFRPASQVDTARMYVVLFVSTNDQNELGEIQDLIVEKFAGKCQYVSESPIIDEILQLTKYTLR